MSSRIATNKSPTVSERRRKTDRMPITINSILNGPLDKRPSDWLAIQKGILIATI
jgi:hypothetical protein